MNRIHHRGPDDQSIWSEGDTALGFVRLAINGDLIEGQQPCADGALASAFNGEIYNFKDLAQRYGLGHYCSDTLIILPLFQLLGPEIIHQLDGFYSGVIVNNEAQKVVCLRDHMGKKPLFFGFSEGDLFITSELKALNHIDCFEPLPIGVSEIDLTSGTVTQILDHQAQATTNNLNELLHNAVLKRLPDSEQPLGLFLSGGLDSSLIASIASKYRDDIHYFTLGTEEGSDHQAVQTVIEALNLKKVTFVPLPSKSEIPALIENIVLATESYNPSIVSNGLATWLLARAARQAGIKVVLTGEGADELFGGYHQFSQTDPWRETRRQLIQDMQFTELRRLDMASMAHSIEARCPFLDAKLRSLSDQFEFEQFYRSNQNKVSLRSSFETYLPESILQRRKTSCDVGSGIRGMVVCLKRNGRSEREELRDIWKQHFPFDHSHPYFHQYAAFDRFIDQRGEEHK
ncbi:asparagine synthetase B family protein [Oceanobacter antarcticus]|uniref:asparagine synthase (glutamine-hydrolyzing) n=1 Tax=Oceanobacter antarcticus TaxID=3133425 RepID=A0ABW8NLG7_9GAMM